MSERSQLSKNPLTTADEIVEYGIRVCGLYIERRKP